MNNNAPQFNYNQTGSGFPQTNYNNFQTGPSNYIPKPQYNNNATYNKSKTYK